MRDQNSRSFAHLVRGKSSSATPAHDIAVSECVSRGGMASIGGEGGFIVTTISPWAALARQRCKFRGGRVLFSAFSSMDDEFSNTAKERAASPHSSPFFRLPINIIDDFSPL